MKKKITTLLLTLILAAIGILSACQKNLQLNAENLSAKFSRKASEEGVITDDVAKNLTSFGVKILNETLNNKKENSLFSPISAAYCLGMMANGAANNTLKEFENLFGTDIGTLNKNLYALNSNLYSGAGCETNVANSLWIKESFPVKDGFLQTAADWYDAEIYHASFDKSTVNDINDWCDYQTDGMIKKIINSIPEQTAMYLINALRFDAEWATKYEKKHVSDGKFTNYGGNTTDAKYLYSTEKRFFEGENYTGFLKNYKDGKYSFAGILPSEGLDIYEFIANLDGEDLFEKMKNPIRTNVKVKFPEFKYESKMDLKPYLQNMGLSDAFDQNEADFSLMSEEPLYCGFINQNTVIDVSRNGTKAAAITWGGMAGTAAPPERIYEVYLTRPFVYAIVDNASGIPLFIGAVVGL